MRFNRLAIVTVALQLYLLYRYAPSSTGTAARVPARTLVTATPFSITATGHLDPRTHANYTVSILLGEVGLVVAAVAVRRRRSLLDGRWGS